MKILVTGASGLLGQELVSLLSEKNQVYALARNRDFEVKKNVSFIKADLYEFDESKLNGVQADAVYYLAQSRKYREFPEGAIDMLEVNVTSPLKIAEWSRKAGVKRFIYASSGGVYNNPEEPVKEFFNINLHESNNYYLGTKLAAELLLKSYAQYFRTFAIVRPFFMYGFHQHEQMLIPRLINSVCTGQTIQLSTDEGIRINPVHVSDAAIACEKILALSGSYIFNIAGNEVISLKKLALMIGEFTRKEPVFTYTSKKQNDLVADTSQMRELLHVPAVTLKKGIGSLCNSLVGKT